MRWMTLFAMAALTGAGCSQSKDGLLPISGTVKYADGSAVAGESATIWFEPADGGKAGTGSISPEGAFELTTLQPGDGVKPGAYKVVLKVYSDYRAQKLATPEAYADATTTPLEATVDSSKTHFDFTVER